MAEKTLNDIFKKDDLKKVYMFYGEENYLKKFYFEMLKKRVIDSSMEEFNYISFDYKNLKASEIMEAINNLPVMSDKKLVVIYDVEIVKMRADIKDFFESSLTNLPDDTVLVIYEDTIEIDIKTAAFNNFQKLINSNGVAVKFERAAERDLISWVCKHIKHEGHDIDSETAKYLLSVTDNNMNNLSNEIAKLSSFVTVEKIEKKHIDKICSKTVEAMAFDLTNNLVSGNAGKAFETLKILYQLRYDPAEILGPVFWGFITMYKVKTGMIEGMSEIQIAKCSGLSDYNVKKYGRCCENISVEVIRKIIQKCAQYDVEMKSQVRDRQLHLEVLLGEIAKLRNR